MTTVLGSLLIKLGLDSGEFKSGMSQAEKDFKRAQREFEKTGKAMQSLGAKLSIAITAPFIALGATAVRDAAAARDALALVNSALASMGNASGKTTEQLKKSAKELQYLSTFDDDEIMRKVTANLLTFGNVAGAQFDRAQRAAVDMATFLNQDLQSATIMIGKALNDPIKGITALGKSGIQFSKEQRQAIRAMVETGRIAEAQSIILGELEREFKAAGKAARDAVPGSDAINKWNDFKETVGEVLLKAFERVEPMLNKVLDLFLNLSPGAQTAAVAIAGLAAAAGPLLAVIGLLKVSWAPFAAGIKLAGGQAAAAGVEVSTFALRLAAFRAGLLTTLQVLGPWALAIGAVAGAYYLMTRRTKEQDEATGRYAKQQREARGVMEKATATALLLANAYGEARKELMKTALADREAVKQKLASARATLLLAKAELSRARAMQVAQNTASIGGGVPGTGAFIQGTGDKGVALAKENAVTAINTVRDLVKQLESINAAINSPEPKPPASAQVSTGTGTLAGARSTGNGRDREEIERQFNNDLIGLTQRILSARSSLAGNAEERAELEMRQVEWSRIQALEEIKQNEDYNATQKAELMAAVERLADWERLSIERDKSRALEQERADLAEVEFSRQRDLLLLADDIANTQLERKRIANQVLDLEQEYRRNMLKLVIASENSSDAEKARAQAILDSLPAIENAERGSLNRGTETDVERFLRSISKTRDEIKEDIDRIKIEGLESLADGLTNVIMGFESLGKTVKKVAQQILADLIQLQLRQSILKPLAGALGLEVPGFARGTNFAPGGWSIVGEEGPELVDLPRGSKVIANNQIGNAMRNIGNGGGNTFVWNVQTPNADSFNRSARQMQSAAKRRLGQ